MSNRPCGAYRSAYLLCRISRPRNRIGQLLCRVDRFIRRSQHRLISKPPSSLSNHDLKSNRPPALSSRGPQTLLALFARHRAARDSFSQRHHMHARCRTFGLMPDVNDTTR
eukprot:3662041-Rhodomonas_salina.2